MIDHDNDPAYWEVIGWQYYGRYKQAELLRQKMEEALTQEEGASNEDIKLLDSLLLTPPAFRGMLEGMWKESVFHRAAQAVEIRIKTTHTRAVLADLRRALSGSAASEVSLTGDRRADFAVPSITGQLILMGDPIKALYLVFEDKELLDESLHNGQDQANSLILRELQNKDAVLWRMPLALAKISLPLITTDSTFQGELPTRLQGVNLKLYYPPPSLLPELSLIVNPLS